MTTTGMNTSALSAVSAVSALDAHLTPAAPVVSVKPVTLDSPGRGTDLRVRISAPAAGSGLPVVLLSHGHGSSLEGYGPLADFWAAHGFVVIQPTHLDSRTVGLPQDDPRTPRLWRFRVEDMKRVLDHLDVLEAAVPGLGGRPDRTRSPRPGTPSAARPSATSSDSASSTRSPDGRRTTCPTRGSPPASCSPRPGGAVPT